MESFNFGAFDTNLGARIAAIPQEAQKQQTANMLQAMQMQGVMRQNEMSQMQLDEMKTDRAEMVKLQQDLAAKGGSPDLNQYADMLLKSPKHMKLGLELKQKLNDQARYAAIMGRTRPAAAPPMAPAVAPEPGSFSADMAARREADPFASRTNMLPGAAAGVNALAGNAAEIEFKRQQRNDLIGMGTTQSIAAAKAIDDDIALLAKEPVYHTVSGVGLVNPRDRSVVMPSVEKPAAPPSMVAEYTFAKTPDGGNFRGSFQDFVTTRAAAARTPGATVVMPPLEKTEQQEKGKLNVKVYGDIAATADRARKILPALETSEAILTGGFKTGFGSDVQTQAARVLSSLGVPEADKYATNSQLFLAQGRQALLQRQLEQKGAQSEGDAQRINQTFIQLGNTPEANKFLVATAKAQAKQDIERQKFYANWWSKSKTYEGAEEAWLDGAGGKSLFDSPDMKSFAPQKPSSDISSAAAAELERRRKAKK